MVSIRGGGGAEGAMTIVEVCATADPIPPAHKPTAMTALNGITLRRTIMFASFKGAHRRSRQRCEALPLHRPAREPLQMGQEKNASTSILGFSANISEIGAILLHRRKGVMCSPAREPCAATRPPWPGWHRQGGAERRRLA